MGIESTWNIARYNYFKICIWQKFTTNLSVCSWNPRLIILISKLIPISKIYIQKENVLSKIAKLYDHLGLSNPIFTKPKILMIVYGNENLIGINNYRKELSFKLAEESLHIILRYVMGDYWKVKSSRICRRFWKSFWSSYLYKMFLCEWRV